VKKSKAIVVLLLILSFMFVFITEIGLVKAVGTVYIRNDGSVEGAGLTFEDGVYVFSGDIYGQIVIEKDGVIVDGSGYVLHGMNEGGIFLENRSNVVLRNIEVVDAPFGITILNGSNNEITESNCTINLENSVNNTISGNERVSLLFTNSSKNIVMENNLTDNTRYGFKLQSTSNENSIFGNNITDSIGGIEFHGNSSYNMVYENNIIDNTDGMMFFNSANNSIYENLIAYNRLAGVYLYSASSNRFFRNDFVDNWEWQATSRFSSNVWDNGSTGNYWSNYNGTDADGDGIGDEPYLVPVYTLMGWGDLYDADNYPLMEPYIIPEFPTWTPLLIMLIAVVAVIVIYRRKLHEQMHRRSGQ
jgi:nitrous oxidase accessory protein